MLDAVDAEAFLVARLGSDVGEVSPIGHGNVAGLRVRRGGTEYIVRFSALDQDFRKDRSWHATACVHCRSGHRRDRGNLRRLLRHLGPCFGGIPRRSRRRPHARDAAGDCLSGLTRPDGSISRRQLATAAGVRMVPLTHQSWRAAWLAIADDRSGADAWLAGAPRDFGRVPVRSRKRWRASMRRFRTNAEEARSTATC